MPINTLPDVKIKTVKVYPLKPVDRQIVDENFDRLTQPTLHDFFFRCLENDTKKTKKSVVINIRGFHKITVTNLYFMSAIKYHICDNWLSIYIGVRRSRFFPPMVGTFN